MVDRITRLSATMSARPKHTDNLALISLDKAEAVGKPKYLLAKTSCRRLLGISYD